MFYCFDVLPFGLSSAPWLFTTVMGHCASAPGYTVSDLTCCSDNEIFGAGSARRPCSQSIGWLIRPTKCVGVSSAVQVFTALGTPALVAGRSLHERRAAGRGSHPHRDRRLLASGRALLVDTSLGRVNGCRIGSTPLALRFDSVTERDASDTGFGAVTFVEGLAEASWGPPLPWSPRCWHMPGAPRPSGRATSGQTSSMPLPLQSTFSTPDAPCCSYTVSHRSCSASPPSSRGAATRLSWTTWGVSSSWGGLVPLFASGARRPTGLPTWKA